jgi:hypothetical protein
VRGAGDPRELLVLAGVVIALAVLWRGLRLGQRLQGYAAVTGDFSRSAPPATAPMLVSDETPPPTPPARRPDRRAA